MSDINERIANLSPEMRALLQRRLEKRTRDGSVEGKQSILCLRDRQQLPLSFAQQRLWFLDQLDPGNAQYNVSQTLRLLGELNLEALELSFNAVISRHEVLRTNYVEREGQAIQVVNKIQPVPVDLVDLQAWGIDEQRQRVKRFVEKESLTSFNLEQGPLLRVHLLRMSEQEHILLLVVHHIISDGWSIGVLFKELSTLYAAYCEEQAPSLPELSIQYAEFAAWQRDWFQGAEFEKQLAYWRRQLTDVHPLNLPTDYPRPTVQSFRGAQENQQLSRTLTRAIKDLGLEQEVTPFMVVLAAFQILLQRHSGSDDIVVGSPILGRNHPETEHLIGVFINTLLLRTDLSGDPTIRELLRRVRDVNLDAYAHQDMPFERLVEELQPERDLSRHPLFDVMINYFPQVHSPLELAGLQVEKVVSERVSSKFAMTLYITEQSDVLHFYLAYQAELFSQERSAWLLQQLVHLLSQMVNAPNRRISDLSLVTPNSHPLLPDPRAALAEPRQESFQAAIAHWASCYPEKVAVSKGGREWSYRQLTTAADALARHLVGSGFTDGTVIGVEGSPGFGLIAAILGVFRSGNVLLSLDETLPTRRRQLMLDEARTTALVRVHAENGDASNQEIAPNLALICVNATDGQVIHEGNPKDIPAVALPEPCGDSPAYIFFTSGTLGVPKGVLGCHKSLSHFINWQRDTFDIGREDRVSQLIGLSFDAVLRDVLLPLSSGGTLCIPEDDDRLDTLNWLDRERVTVVHTVPTLAQSWLADALEVPRLEAIRRLFISGEPLTETLVLAWRRILTKTAEIINLYGPTETTLTKCFYRIPGDVPPGVQSVGWPMSDTQALVLAPNNRLCGIGESGEIVVRTPFSTLGYINASQENSSRFVKNPFREDAQDVLYKTGDSGRYRPDGSLEILGRLDHQVKVRGVRIEPDEVAAVLTRHEFVEACTVLANQDDEGHYYLTAYVVEGDNRTSVEQLRSYLADRLSAEMVPSAYMCIEELPRLPNGKVDRAALPQPDRESFIVRRQFAAPDTLLEKAVSAVWSKVLGVGKIGVHDNFFDLGGHSLLATQLISRINRQFGLKVPLRLVFESPTIAEFLQSLPTELRTRLESSLDENEVQAATEDEENVEDAAYRRFPLSFTQQRLWFLEQLEPGRPTYNITKALHLTGKLDLGALQHAFDGLIQRQASLRTAFHWVGDKPLQVIVDALKLKVVLVDLSALSPDERRAKLERRIEEESLTPFDLEKGPLFRVKLLRLGSDDSVLLMTTHHIVSDGWSKEIMNRELSVLYAASVSGRTAPLSALPMQYTDYTAWQKEWLQGEILAEQLAYWKQQLDGLSTLDLPLDHPRPPVQSFEGASHEFTLPINLVTALKKLSGEQGVTLFMTLLAAFQVLLYRYTGQTDVAIGTAISGRNRVELEGIIGFFANTLVLRSDLSGDPNFGELLARVRQVALDAYAHQEMPFEKLVEELLPNRDLSRNPLFQVGFVFHNLPESLLKFAELDTRVLPSVTRTAKFDLDLSFREAGDELRGLLTYSTQLFEVDRIERMALHYTRLLEAIVANVDQRISVLPLMTASAQRQLLIEWNDTHRDFPWDKCIHELFEAHASSTPDVTAVYFEGVRLSYIELNNRANQLAHRLRTLEIKPGKLVGICMDRSFEMMIAILGTLKAGGAYVPLDPTYPTERLNFMLEDTQVSVLLADRDLTDRFHDYAGNTLLLNDNAALTQEPVTNLSRLGSAEDLAYVIYTSGSTGTPKGVCVSHRGLSNVSSEQSRIFGTGPGCRVLQHASISFDAAVLEWVMALTSGATLYLDRKESLLPGVELIEFLRYYKITHTLLPPSVLHATSYADLPELQTLILGGEDCPASLFKRWSAGRRLFNAYGPTEATIFSTVAACEDGNLPVTMGRPIGNARVYVLDRNLQPLPVGIPGELYIGGVGVARGYLNREDLTAQKFIPDPFSTDRKDRLYKTGDLVRYLPDGNIKFLGRIDHQVKLRGFRIELGEIEAVLEQQPKILNAVVVLREDQPGDRRLVAYVVIEDGVEVDERDIWDCLKQKLPEYMLPSHLVALDELPLTVNGKVDRRSLPKPKASGAGTDSELIAPRNRMEEAIMAIWSDVLGVNRIGIDDNFFELGGHSILATQVVSRIGTRLGVTVPVRVLFENPTLAELAARISSGTRTEFADMPAKNLDDPIQSLPRSSVRRGSKGKRQ